MEMKNSLIKLSIITSALVFSGCSIKVEKLTPEEIQTSVKNNMVLLKKNENPVVGAISLDEAISRATTNNREHRVKLLEEEFRKKELLISENAMLPSLNVSDGYTHRNNELASRSKNIFTGNQSYDYSTSTDKNLNTAEARISWNALDFGLAYVRAKQDADNILIAHEEQRKVDNQIQQDVREAYWKAVSAQNLLAQINPVVENVKKSINESRQLEESLTGNVMDSLNARREMLDILISLQNLKRDLLTAKPRLAVLMGLTPNTEFTLSDQISEDKIQVVNFNIEKMEELAFFKRPELMKGRYQERIALQETKAVMYSIFPGIAFDAGVNYTSNSYTYNSSWYDYGVRVNMNLFKVFGYKALKAKAQANELIVKEQQNALGMAVLTQVHLANIRYKEAFEQWDSTNQYYNVTNKVSAISKQANSNNIASKQQVARDELSKLIANVKRDMAYAELQNSLGAIYESLGLEHNSKELDKVIE